MGNKCSRILRSQATLIMRSLKAVLKKLRIWALSLLRRHRKKIRHVSPHQELNSKRKMVELGSSSLDRLVSKMHLAMKKTLRKHVLISLPREHLKERQLISDQSQNKYKLNYTHKFASFTTADNLKTQIIAYNIKNQIYN